MHPDGRRAVFFLYRRRPGLVQRVIVTHRNSGFDALHRPGMTVGEIAAPSNGMLYTPLHGMDRRGHRAGGAAAWRILSHRRTLDARSRPPPRPGARRGGVAGAAPAAAPPQRARRAGARAPPPPPPTPPPRA